MATIPPSDPEIERRRRTLHRFLVVEVEYAAPSVLAVATLVAMLLAHRGLPTALVLAVLVYLVTHFIAKRFLIH